MAKYIKRIIWAIIILALIGGGYFLLKPKASKTVYTTEAAKRGDLARTVSVTGDMKDNEEIITNFELGGRVTKVYVKVGDKLAVGDKIATIDDVNISDQARQAKAALDKAIADAGSNDDSIREAKVKKDNAEELLDKTNDVNDQRIKAAEQLVKNAQDYYDDTLAYYNASPSLEKKLTLTSAANSLDTAKQSVKVAKDQADLEETAADNNLNNAKAELKTAESDFGERSRNASIDEAQAGYDASLNTLSKTILKAPINGVITEINNKVGEILGTGVIKESFARLISLDFLIEANVPESDIAKIKMGQAATVTFDALTPDDKYQASIVEIDPASTVIQDVVYYGIKLRLTSVDPRLKPGMTANVDIHTAEVDNVLMIPLRAVQTEDGQKYVQVMVDEKYNIVERKNVTTGLEGDEGMVEVTSGLNAGDKVVTFTKTQ